MKFHVTYFYLATGMEGHADTADYGIVEAVDANSAKQKIAEELTPPNKNYGHGFTRESTIQWVMGCLSAKPVKS